MSTALAEQVLDDLAFMAGGGSENWPRRRHGRGCACKGCLRAELASEAATAKGKITLPGSFSGWQGSTRLSTILRSPTQASAVFSQRGRKLLYRIIQIDHPNYPIYIGITWGAKSSIRKRLMDHTLGRDAASRRVLQPYRPEAPEASEIKRLRQYLIKQALRGKHNRISVQWGRIDGIANPSPKLLHAYELTLQVLERPTTFSGRSLSFD